MAKIQKALPGLAKFLGIETQGLVRLDSGTVVQPVVEIEDFLSPNPFVLVRTTFTAIGQDAEVEVPANKFWRLKWMSVAFAPIAGQSVTFMPYLRKSFQASNFIMPLTPSNTMNITASVSAQGNPGSFGGFGFPLNKLNAYPGDFIGMRLVSRQVAGNFSGDFYLQYQQLDL